MDKRSTFKMAFLMWRIWKGKVPIDEYIRRWGIQGPTRCCCCTNPEQDTISYMFLRALYANKTCSYFSSIVGIIIIKLSFRDSMLPWWNVDRIYRGKPYYKAVPNMTT